ncbi:MAG: outer membrane beta-barrel protein [Verrucomicrobiota bacterium]
MKFNKWTLGLAAVGVVSLTSAARADETNMVKTALSSTTISGYVDVAAQFNPNGGSGGSPNYYFNSNPNSINLNAVDIALDKPLDESPWASGYHVEFLLGPVATAEGLNNNIRQAYVALRTPVGNGIDWKVGVFDTIVGYESTTTANNPNYSHSYGFNIEPTTHTGVLAAYKATDWISMQAGVLDNAYAGGGVYNAGVGAVNSGLYRPSFTWGNTLTAPDSFGWAKGATLSLATVISGGNTGGNPGNGNGGGAQTYYAGISLPTPIAALKFGASFDYLAAHDVSQNEWTAALYSTYQFNDKLSLNLRGEYLDAKALNAGNAYTSTSGGNNECYELTSTLQYAMWANVLTRLEFRWDHSNHTGAGGYYQNTSTGAGLPQQDAFMLAAQAVYTF